jgi:hypothetical protein
VLRVGHVCRDCDPVPDDGRYPGLVDRHLDAVGRLRAAGCENESQPQAAAARPRRVLIARPQQVRRTIRSLRPGGRRWRDSEDQGRDQIAEVPGPAVPVDEHGSRVVSPDPTGLILPRTSPNHPLGRPPGSCDGAKKASRRKKLMARLTLFELEAR